MNNPKINEEVHNVGGSMYISKVIDDSHVKVACFYARWIVLVCKVVRHNNQLWAF